MSSDKDLHDRLKEIKKDLNLDVRKLTDNMEDFEVETVSTGSLAIDLAAGRGGWVRGRITEMYGPEAGGKTTLALCAIAAVQKQGGKALFIDAEQALDPQWAAKLGVDIDQLHISQPNTGEQALELVCQAANVFDIIVIDSVSSLVPQAELEGSLEESKARGLHAKMMSEGLRKVSQFVGKSKCICIFINQIRLNPNAMMSNPEYTTGGQALKFYASIRVDVRKISSTQIKDESGGIIGHQINVKFVKNKVAAPHKEAKATLYFTHGIDQVADLLNVAEGKGLFKQSGAWIYFGDKEEYKWQGWEKLKEALASDVQLRELLLQKVK